MICPVSKITCKISRPIETRLLCIGVCKKIPCLYRKSNKQNIRHGIINTFTTVTPGMLRDEGKMSFRARIDKFLEENGRNFGHLLR